MTRFLYHLRFAIVALWLPCMGWACDYPAPLRAISATLMSVQHSGGQVKVFHRARLRQALGRMDVSAVQRDMANVLGRADRRAVSAMLTLSFSLANGTGRTLSAQNVDHAQHLATAIRNACLADTQAKAKNTATDAALEQGKPQTGGDGATGLTFRQGLTRLSLIFTIYMASLAIVIRLRMGRKRAFVTLPDEQAPPQGGRSFTPSKKSEISSF